MYYYGVVAGIILYGILFTHMDPKPNVLIGSILAYGLLSICQLIEQMIRRKFK